MIVRSAYGAIFSPYGRRLSFFTDITGVAEVWSVPIEINVPYPAWPTQLTFSGERIASASFSPKADLLLVSSDVGGNERTQLYRVSGDGSTFTALTAKPDVMYLFGGWSPDGTRITYSSNERDTRFFDVYERDMQSGVVKPLLVQDGTNHVKGYSPDGQQVLVERYKSNTRNSLLLVNVATREVHNLTPDPGEVPALHTAAAWSADRRGLYLLSNQGRQFLSLAYLDLATTQLIYLSDTSWDIERLAVTQDGRRIALVTNTDGYSLLEIFDVSNGWEGRQPLLTPTLPFQYPQAGRERTWLLPPQWESIHTKPEKVKCQCTGGIVAETVWSH